MIRIRTEVQGDEFEVRLPENIRDLKKLALDEFSVLRLLQVSIHQRQLQHIAMLKKGGYSHDEIQRLMDVYVYKANDTGGSVTRL